MIQIKRTDSITILQMEIPEGSLVHRELMGEHYVRLQFSLDKPAYFELGDYMQTDFGLFELTSPYSPKYNTETDGFDYDIQLDAHYMKWKNKKCRYIPLSSASETTFDLTTTLDIHLSVILNNINALGKKDSNFLYNGKAFVVQYMNCPAETKGKSKYLKYANIDIITALSNICNEYDVEWWVEDNIIFIGKCKINGEEVPFEQGVNVSEMSRSESTSEYATRLIVFGSTRNLPTSYRKDTSADITKNGVIQKRLMLPLDKCPNGYVQSDEVVRETQAIEAIYITDDIYPRMKCIVSNIETYDKTVENEDKTTTTQTFYRVYDKSGFKFSTDMKLPGENLHIIFQSGSLIGMDFECQYNDDKKYYEVVANDTYGRTLPDSTLHPSVNDEFILYNWDATKLADTGLVEAAEEELYKIAVNKLADLKIDPNTYDCTLYSDSALEANTEYGLGQPIKLINPSYFVNGRSSRVIGFEIKLDIPYDSPKYIIGESAAYSFTKATQEALDAITYNGNSYQSSGGSNGGSNGGGVYLITYSDNTPPSDYNAYSARRTDRMFLRKDVPDTALQSITFNELSRLLKGIQFGESFADGQAGFGGKIDGRGVGYLESLTLRSFLEAPEYRFNRISIRVGNDWRAAGGGIIENVEIDHDEEGNELQRGTVYLHLEEGEIGKIAVDDICQGIWHDHMTLSNNSTDDYDDGIGNFRFGGFFTAYFRIVEVMSVNGGINNAFRYVLRSDKHRKALHHPASMMHFVAYGNFTDKTRQSSRYSTLTYERYLKDVNDWEFTEDNIAAQFGDLSNLSIFGLNMTGYSAYLNNIYMSGTIQQFVKLGRKMHIDQSLGGFMAPGEIETVTVSILDGYMQDHTEEYTFMVERDTGDTAADDVWNAMPEHINCGASFKIAFEDLHINPNHGGISTLFHVTADNGKEEEKVSTAIEY